MNKLKKPDITQGKNISVNSGSTESTNNRTPLFCLEYLQPEYCLSNCQKEEKAAFADALFKRSKMLWSEIIETGRHAAGCETIKRDAIRASIPTHLTEDVRFLALRFKGKAPMVGYREGRIFHILWIDRNFTLYKH